MSFNRNLPTQISRLRQLEAQANNQTVNLSLGRPLESFPAELAPDLGAVAHNDLGYTPNSGLPALREALAQYCGLQADNFCVTNGAQEALFATLFARLNPGAEVIIPVPTFLAYATMVESLQGRAVTVAKNPDFSVNVDTIKAALTDKTSAIVLCSPDNPTAGIIPATIIAELLELAEQHDLLLLIDEVYRELIFAAKPDYADHARLVRISSLSKSASLPGFRIGWAACPDSAVVQRITVAHQYISTCAPAVSQQLALAALTKLSVISQRLRQEYHANMQACCRALGAAATGAAFYLFLPVPGRYKDDEDFCRSMLQKHNILLCPGSVFWPGNHRHVRLSYALPQAQLTVALQLLQTEFK